MATHLGHTQFDLTLKLTFQKLVEGLGSRVVSVTAGKVGVGISGCQRLFRPPEFRRILTFAALFAQKAPTRRSGVLTGLSDSGGELFSWAGSFPLFLPSFPAVLCLASGLLGR